MKWITRFLFTSVGCFFVADCPVHRIGCRVSFCAEKMVAFAVKKPDAMIGEEDIQDGNYFPKPSYGFHRCGVKKRDLAP